MANRERNPVDEMNFDLNFFFFPSGSLINLDRANRILKVLFKVSGIFIRCDGKTSLTVISIENFCDLSVG